MNKQASLFLILCLAGAPAFADEQEATYQNNASTEETAGFFTGMAIGAVAGGPPGAMLGAAIGALTGDGFRARKHNSELTVDLYESRLELAAARDELLEAQREVQLAQQQVANLRLQARVMPATLPVQSAPCCHNTVVSIHFRSGSSEIEQHYEEQLQSLVNIAEQMPTASMEITGYADRNGDTEMNLRLSRERSQSIARFMGDRGIENSSISTVAYGESRPLQSTQSVESDFFDRRVIVRLRDNSQSMLTRTPDGE